jgi:hypothetical protein
VPPVTIPEPSRNPASRTGDLWILGGNRLLCGDSTSAADVRRLMNGERAILFATDPPYLVDYDGSNHPTRNMDWSKIGKNSLLARAGSIALLFRQALVIGRGVLLQLLLGHRVIHFSRGANETTYFRLSAFGGKCGTGGLLLCFGFCGHEVFLHLEECI